MAETKDTTGRKAGVALLVSLALAALCGVTEERD
jgi:hypothetical protein